MSHLHSFQPPYIHRDLRSHNILLKKQGGDIIAKIGDFGLTASLALSTSLISIVNDNPLWLPPEVLQYKPYNLKADVYSYGMILWEICTQDYIFPESTFSLQIIERICAGERPVIPEGTNPCYMKIMNQCWETESSKRPSFDEIVSLLDSVHKAPVSAMGWMEALEATHLEVEANSKTQIATLSKLNKRDVKKKEKVNKSL